MKTTKISNRLYSKKKKTQHFHEFFLKSGVVLKARFLLQRVLHRAFWNKFRRKIIYYRSVGFGFFWSKIFISYVPVFNNQGECNCRISEFPCARLRCLACRRVFGEKNVMFIVLLRII